MKKIAAVVMNSVSHDSRVLKQADSLAEAGYEAAVFGIQDVRCPEAESVRPSGARIFRCDWAPLSYAVRARLNLLGGAALATAAVALLLTFLEAIHAYWLSSAFPLHLGILLAATAARPFYNKYRRFKRAADVLGGGPERRPPRLAEALGELRQFLSKERNRWVQTKVRERLMVRALVRFRPDAVHCHDVYTLSIGSACARKTGCRLVFDSHEIYEEQSLANRFDRLKNRRTQRRLGPKLDGFVTVNRSIAEWLASRHPHFPPAVIVKNAAKMPDAELAYDGRLHRAAQLGPDRRILLFQGGFARFRGLDTLLESAPLLPRGWCVVMMGWGQFETALRKIAASVDPQGWSIRFVPGVPQAELIQWTAGAALGAIPYQNNCLNHWYCSPNKLWEYPAAGVPILASPFPELEKVVCGHNIGRLLSDPVTPEGIAAAVAALSDGDLAEMRRNCGHFIRADNWSVYERRLVGLYDRLLGRAPQSVPHRAAGWTEQPLRAAEPTSARQTQSG
ncbi:MAG: glycosyltransferase family 4 protein [Acidobacteriota bacterium]